MKTNLLSSDKDPMGTAIADYFHHKGRIPDYIVEPSVDVVMGELLPKVLRMKMFTVLLDSNASEHAARTMAMQIATDNANDLLQDLTVMYNKSRQQAITNELLDIVGGSMA
jgi:F-type H+-transporting ATPase subunit gamma